MQLVISIVALPIPDSLEGRAQARKPKIEKVRFIATRKARHKSFSTASFKLLYKRSELTDRSMRCGTGLGGDYMANTNGRHHAGNRVVESRSSGGISKVLRRSK